MLFFLASCAKPTVVDIIQPNDDELNCEELKDEIAESQKVKEEAEFSKDSGGNIARLILLQRTELISPILARLRKIFGN